MRGSRKVVIERSRVSIPSVSVEGERGVHPNDESFGVTVPGGANGSCSAVFGLRVRHGEEKEKTTVDRLDHLTLRDELFTTVRYYV